MGRRRRRNEQRNQTIKISDPRLFELLGGHGVGHVSPGAVLSNLSVAARCVALRSELIASVPLRVYRRTADGGRELADDLPLHSVLSDLANPNQTAYEMREMLVRSLDLGGNGFARIERDGRGQVVALWPTPWHNVTVELLVNGGGRLRYRFSEPGRPSTVLLQEEVLHVRASTGDGCMGQSPIAVARGALGHALQIALTDQSVMRNAVRPSGVIFYPNILNPQQRADLTALVNRQTAGEKSGGILVIEGGGEFKPTLFSARDTELLGSRKLSAEDVARVFGVPPAVLGIGERPTYGSAVEESRQLVVNCLAPLAARIESAMTRCLLTEAGRRAGLSIAHDLDSLLRGDLKSRFEAYRIGREIGVFSVNDIRVRENSSPVPDGDGRLQPLNYAPLGAAPVPPREARGE